MIPLAYSAPAFSTGWKKIAAVLLLTWGVFIQLAGMLTNWHGRIGQLLERHGREAVLFTVTGSQGLDAIKAFISNLCNLVAGRRPPFELTTFHPSISDVSRYASETLYTWWNRLLYLGTPAPAVFGVLAFILMGSFFCAWSIRKYLNPKGAGKC